MAAPSRNLLSWEEAHVKAEKLVSQMSIDQKAGLATGQGWETTLCVGQTYGSTNPDFPSLCLQDGPAGIRWADNVTASVSGINVAASWDKDLIYKRGEYMGDEFYLKGIHMALGPSFDIMRSPRGGRGWEAFGEDPYLQGVAASLTISGIQEQGVIAVPKHYILNNQETNRKNSSSDIDKRTLHEVYVWPYARAIEAGLGGVMCSYNQINGTWTCEHEYVLTTVLKEELNFQGLIMSDWGAQMSNEPSANAGLDMTMPGDIVMGDGYSWWGSNLTKAVEEGRVPEERVTDMAQRIAAAYYKMRQDEGFPDIGVNGWDRESAPVRIHPDMDKHIQVTRDIGAASVVLLQNNDNTLPLSSDVKKIALIGSDAGPIPQGLNGCEDQSCGAGHLAMGWGSGTVDFPYLITPADGITARAGDGVEVVTHFDDWDLEKAKEIAADADVVFVFGMADSGEEYISVDGNVGDRKNMSLWHNGDNLIEAVAEASDNVVVVINAVGSVLMPWIDNESIKSVVWPGLAGQESGNALADVLFGDVNPSGRLPYTIAVNEEDYGATIDPNFNVVYHEKLEVGYKHFDAHDIEPLFAFGHGLSYSSFEYGKLKVKAKKDKASATVEVTNVGDVDGAEVAQAYLGFPESAGAPPKNLRGFEKVYLKAGKKSKVTFEFETIDLSYWNEESETWVVPEGEFTLYVGASSRDIRETATFTL
ncbi:glycoside hydrolase superfamily [Zychaea mexicana]|uniref:glycoside hydrolase superfamily n=1 Tax=Zychaea mexicana TaxID=64656 RepID=UPI0022FEA1EA|nr:glycoside hydrolase superfamily [Zychaea mexicana]KAI9493634.1 glycoside hydrolase superfamily [Zychaea mexicana]